MPEKTSQLTEDQAAKVLRGLYKQSGYTQFRMSKFEEYDLYVRNKDFLVSDSVITFTDTNGKLMALKPDVTLSIVKNTKDSCEGVRRVFYNENVYRPANNSRTFREIMQVGLECIGDIDDYCVAEVLCLAGRSLAEISDDYMLVVSDLGIVTEMLRRFEIPAEAEKRLIRCLQEKNSHDIPSVCNEFGISDENKLKFTELLSCGSDISAAIPVLQSFYDDDKWKTEIRRFSSILLCLPGTHTRIDFSVVCDIKYYSGIVFQGYLKGIPSSLLSGGQYDHLMRRMGKTSRAVGFAVYLDQLGALEHTSSQYDVDVLLLYSENDDICRVLHTADEIRANGTSVCVQRTIPDGLRYRRKMLITESGVKIVC